MDLEPLKRYLEPRAKSLADLFVAGLEWVRMNRFPYGWAGETLGWRYGKDLTPLNPYDPDCSGVVGSGLWFARALNEGSGLHLPGNARWPQDNTYKRPTARVLHALSEPVTDGTVRTGDLVTFQRRYYYRFGKRKGLLRYAAAPHHVVPATRQRNGVWLTIESPSAEHTLADVLARKHATGLRRLPGLDLGEVTLPPLPLGIADMELAGARPLLKRGATGVPVIALKRCLNYHLGCRMSLDLKYSFGRITQGYVKRFQQKHDLPVTGNVDDATWRAILGQR